MDINPFPPLQWNKDEWTGSLTLPEWSGFLDCSGPYNDIASSTPSNGIVNLTVVTPFEQEIIFPEQNAAFVYLKENGESIRDAILTTIFQKYSEWQEEFGYDDDEKGQYMPDLSDAQQLKSLMGPATIFIHTWTKDGMAYIGFDCGCTWDDEHGLGILVHGTRIMEVGGSEVAFTSRGARGDGGMDLAPPPTIIRKTQPVVEEPESTQFSLFE